jgi:hypothetical protein
MKSRLKEAANAVTVGDEHRVQFLALSGLVRASPDVGRGHQPKV